MQLNEIGQRYPSRNRNGDDANTRVLKNVEAIRQALNEIQQKVAEYEALAVKGNATWGHVGDLAFVREHTRYAAGHEHDEDPQ